MSKLDDQTAEQIRKEAKHWRGKGMLRVFAMRHKVSERTISLLLNGRTHVSTG